MKSQSDLYKKAGVDINEGYRSVELIKESVKRTMIPGVLSGLGGFGGLFAPDLTGIKKPVLVSGTDGVGTKLRLAFEMNQHDTIGIDCVAMCVNDVLCSGATPLFFLDYLALGKNIPELVAQVVSGVAEGCVQAGCALIGGETAEMPGFYPVGEYDIAGFCVGMVDEEKIIDKNKVSAGDLLIALPSSGPHSNGFSLIRKVVSDSGLSWSDRPQELQGQSLGDSLLSPTRIYVKALTALFDQVQVLGLAHITGGGFYENIPRMLPEGLGAVIQRSEVKTPAVFDLLMRLGDIPQDEMFSTFNMGVGMVVCVKENQAQRTLSLLKEAGEAPYLLGYVEKSEKGLRLC